MFFDFASAQCIKVGPIGQTVMPPPKTTAPAPTIPSTSSTETVVAAFGVDQLVDAATIFLL